MKKIIVVDDEKTTVELLTTVLENEGYDVTGAYNGADCLEKIKKEGMPDLIILDIMMPEMNGWDTAANIKINPKLKDIPIIFLTAKSDNVSKNMGRITAEFYIEKPFEISNLIERIDEVLSQKKKK